MTRNPEKFVPLETMKVKANNSLGFVLINKTDFVEGVHIPLENPPETVEQHREQRLKQASTGQSKTSKAIEGKTEGTEES